MPLGDLKSLNDSYHGRDTMPFSDHPGSSGRMDGKERNGSKETS